MAKSKSKKAGACRPRQRGAVAPMVAIMLGAIAVSGFCALEIGRVYYAQRQLQTLANTAAMDAVRVASGCANGIPDVSLVNNSSMDTAVQNAVAHSISVNQPSSTSFVPLNGLSSTTNAGRSINDIDTSGAANTLRYFNTVTSRPTADAVKVSLTASRPAMLTNLIPYGTTMQTMNATATARQMNVASWQVRTSLLTLNTANGVLGPLLGIANLNLSVASYQSLLSASLPAASVAAALGVSNPQNVSHGTLAAVSLPLPTALNNLANALAATGQNAAANVLSGLASQASTAYTVSPAGLFPGTLTAISPVASLDAYDLLASLAQTARQGSPVAVQTSVTIANTLHVGAFVVIGGAQVPGFGPPGLDANGNPLDPQNAQNSSSSVGTLKVRMQLPTQGTGGLLSGLLGLLAALNNPLLHVNASYNIGIDIPLPQGTSGLASLTCPSRNGLAYNYQLLTKISPLAVKVGTFNYSGSWPMTNPPDLNTSGNINLVSATLLGLPVLTIGMTGQVTANIGAITTNTLNVSVPVPVANPFTAITSSSVGTQNILTGITSSLNTTLTPNITVVGLQLGAVVSDLVTTLTPILSSLDTSILNPTLSGLGLQLGSTYVEIDAPPPSPSGLPPVIVSERADANDTHY